MPILTPDPLTQTLTVSHSGTNWQYYKKKNKSPSYNTFGKYDTYILQTEIGYFLPAFKPQVTKVVLTDKININSNSILDYPQSDRTVTYTDSIPKTGRLYSPVQGQYIEQTVISEERVSIPIIEPLEETIFFIEQNQLTEHWTPIYEEVTQTLTLTQDLDDPEIGTSIYEITQTLTLTQVITKSTLSPLTQTLSFTQTIDGDAYRSLTQTLTLTQTVSTNHLANLSLTQSLALTQSISRLSLNVLLLGFQEQFTFPEPDSVQIHLGETIAKTNDNSILSFTFTFTPTERRAFYYFFKRYFSNDMLLVDLDGNLWRTRFLNTKENQRNLTEHYQPDHLTVTIDFEGEIVGTYTG